MEMAEEENPKNKTRRKRCPPGTYYDKTTGLCKPKIQIMNTESEPAQMKGLVHYFYPILKKIKHKRKKQIMKIKKQVKDVQKVCIEILLLENVFLKGL